MRRDNKYLPYEQDLPGAVLHCILPISNKYDYLLQVPIIICLRACILKGMILIDTLPSAVYTASYPCQLMRIDTLHSNRSLQAWSWLRFQSPPVPVSCTMHSFRAFGRMALWVLTPTYSFTFLAGCNVATMDYSTYDSNCTLSATWGVTGSKSSVQFCLLYCCSWLV